MNYYQGRAETLYSKAGALEVDATLSASTNGSVGNVPVYVTVLLNAP